MMNDSLVETSIAPWLAVNDGAKAVVQHLEFA